MGHFERQDGFVSDEDIGLKNELWSITESSSILVCTEGDGFRGILDGLEQQSRCYVETKSQLRTA